MRNGRCLLPEQVQGRRAARSHRLHKDKRLLTYTCHVQAAISDVSRELKQSTVQMTHSLKARSSPVLP